MIKLRKLEMVPDSHWHGYLSRCKHVLITSTSRSSEVSWPWSWRYIWPKRLPPFSGRFWLMRPRSCTMTVRCTCFALITGYSRFTSNYCTHRLDAMLPGNVKENDLAVAWHGLQRIPNHPNSGRLGFWHEFHGWIGGSCMRIPYRSGFRPSESQWCCNSCNRVGPLMSLYWNHERIMLRYTP